MNLRESFLGIHKEHKILDSSAGKELERFLISVLPYRKMPIREAGVKMSMTDNISHLMTDVIFHVASILPPSRMNYTETNGTSWEILPRKHQRDSLTMYGTTTQGQILLVSSYKGEVNQYALLRRPNGVLQP